MTGGGDFDIETLTIDPTDSTLVPAHNPRTLSDHKARRYFVKVPWTWVQKLDGASGQTYRLALALLYHCWRGRNSSITLSGTRAGRSPSMISPMTPGAKRAACHWSTMRTKM